MDERILVTGATGFLGEHVARQLADDGFEVIGTGRDARRGVRLADHGVRFAPVDLGDQPSLDRICEGVDSIIHCAALSTAWASRSAYEADNVTGTMNLLAAAVSGGARRFVHVSTPAVLSRFEHQYDLTESGPLPGEFTSLYGATKADAEQLVQAAAGLETVIIRPKAIYGPGDRALLPRLVDAAARRRLPIIGDGTTLTHITHVDDVVAALRLAATADGVSGVYHVAGPEAVNLWDMLDELLPLLGYPAPTRHLSVERAMRIARAMETGWRTLRLPSEPPLTQYKVGVLAYSQTLDTSRARDELGYVPKVTLDAGLESVLTSWDHGPPAVPISQKLELPVGQPPVRVAAQNVGRVRPPSVTVGERGTGRTMLPVLTTMIDHPDHGVVQFDAGYGPNTASSKGLFARAYRGLLKPEIEARPAARPATIVVSHADPDHIGGLIGEGAATIVMDAAAWAALSRSRVPWRSGIALPPDLAARVRLIDTASGPVDLFGDGSMVAVALPGHAPGHLGLVVTDDRQYVLCGDGALTRDHIRRARLGTTALIAGSRRRARVTLAGLNRIASTTEAVLVPSHCPETADELVGPGWRAPAGRNGR